jgi:hypothetical protein
MLGRNFAVYPDAGIRLAISRAVGIEGSRGWKISKDKQAHKIDVVVALGMAALAAVKAQGQSTYDASLSWVNGPTTGTEAERNAEWRRQRFAVYVGSGGMIRL